jgi:hypothetical protein
MFFFLEEQTNFFTAVYKHKSFDRYRVTKVKKTTFSAVVGQKNFIFLV